MKAGFLEKLIERLGRIGPEEVQNYFLRLAQEGELRQELLERGLDPRSVRRAVRYGRAHELSEST